MRQNAHRLLVLGLIWVTAPCLVARADDSPSNSNGDAHSGDGSSQGDGSSNGSLTPAPATSDGSSRGRWGGRWGGWNRRYPSNGERLASELPPNQFDAKFLEQFKNAVDTLARDPQVQDQPPEEAAKTVQDRLNETPPQNMATRLKETAATIVPETKATTIVIELPKLTGPQTAPAKAEDATKAQSQGPGGNAQQAPAASFGPTTTIIRAKTTSVLSPNWGGSTTKQASVLDELNLRRAERSFKEINAYASGGPQKKPEPAVPIAAVEKKPEAVENVRSSSILYVERRPVAEGDSEGTGGGDRTVALLEANLEPPEGSWALRTQQSFESLRRHVNQTPWEGILVNVILLVSGTLLLALVAGKRRRLATAGYPPASARRARAAYAPESPEAPVPSSFLLPAGRAEEEEEGVTGSWSGQTGASVPLNDDIRVAFDPRVKRWVLKRREAGGGMSAPLAELQPGTVVRGTALGARSPLLRYKLSPTHTWIPTEESEQIIISVKADHFRAANG